MLKLLNFDTLLYSDHRYIFITLTTRSLVELSSSPITSAAGTKSTWGEVRWGAETFLPPLAPPFDPGSPGAHRTKGQELHGSRENLLLSVVSEMLTVLMTDAAVACYVLSFFILIFCSFSKGDLGHERATSQFLLSERLEFLKARLCTPRNREGGVCVRANVCGCVCVCVRERATLQCAKDEFVSVWTWHKKSGMKVCFYDFILNLLKIPLCRGQLFNCSTHSLPVSTSKLPCPYTTLNTTNLLFPLSLL